MDIFNEGIGHGGFAASVLNGSGGTVATGVIFDPFNIDPTTNVIDSPNQVGTVRASAGVNIKKTFTATAQLPIDGSNNPIPLEAGYYFTDGLEGTVWRITHAPREYQSGQVWKQNISGQQKLA